MNILKIKNKKLIIQPGFTLVELMVVIIIIIILGAIVILDSSGKKEFIKLQNDSENLLFNIRKTQSLAMAVNNAGAGNYQNGYGMYLTSVLGNPPGPQEIDPFSYIIFSDFENSTGAKNWDRAYLENSTANPCGTPVWLVSECFEKITMNDMNYVASIELCDTYCNGTDFISITFLRPNLDAYFCTTASSGGGCTTPISAGYVKITLKSPDTGQSKIINVWSTGQISLE